jgi:predicted anti-sigma-YlaC factor YlaD
MDQQKDQVCREIKDKLSAYLDGELESTLCAEIEQHLQGCDNCRVVVDTLNKTITLYRNYGQASVPPDAHDRLTRVLHLERLKLRNSGAEPS